MGCLMVMFSLLLAVGLSAQNLQQGDKALAEALGAHDQNHNSEGDGEDDRGGLVINDAPPYDEDEEVGDALENTVVESIQPPRESPVPITITSGDGWDDEEDDKELGNTLENKVVAEEDNEELGDVLENTVVESIQPPRPSPAGPPMVQHQSGAHDPQPSGPTWFRTDRPDQHGSGPPSQSTPPSSKNNKS